MLVGTVVFVCLGSGCGMYDRDVHLVYNRAVSGVHSDQGGSIYVEMPTCPRLVKKGNGSYIVGEIDIGGNSNMGNLVTSDSVPQWIAGALCTELRAAGFTPQVVDKLPPTAERGISTYVVKTWIDGSTLTTFTSVDASAETHLRMTLYQGGSVVKEFDARGAGGYEAGQSLTDALENCMKKAVPLIVAGFGQ